MTALEIKDTKGFMNHLFLRDTFEFMHLVEAVVIKSYTVTMEGRKNFPPEEKSPEEEGAGTDGMEGQDGEGRVEKAEYLSYAALRPLLLEHIKGKETPYQIRIVLFLPFQEFCTMKKWEKEEGDVSGFFLNIRFDGHKVQCVTGTNYRAFSLDKEEEKAWDLFVRNYFSEKGIEFEG